MTATTTPAKPKTFRLRVTNRNTITLPADLRENLGIGPGDAIEITLNGHRARLRPAPDKPPAPPPADEDAPPLQGLLRDYFTDWEDIKRFIEDERHGCEEREPNRT